MRAFVDFWFEQCNRGMMEIGWPNPAEGPGPRMFERFALNDAQTLVARAAAENMVPGQNIYIRACTMSGARQFSTDAEFVQAPGLWSDMDDEADIEKARNVESMIRPNAYVITGTVPGKRVQSWFRAELPLLDGAEVKRLNERLWSLYGGDRSVTNPSRLMRLAGSIAWPWKLGRVPELATLVMPTDGRFRGIPAMNFRALLPGATPDNAPADDAPPWPQTPPGGAPGPGGIAPGLSTVSAHIAVMRANRGGWHNAMIRLVAHWVGRGWSNAEILGMAPTLTCTGYTVPQTEKELLVAAEGARRKWGVADEDHQIAATPDKPFGEHLLDPWDVMTPPAFPIHILPDALARWVEARARVMGADPCGLAWAALSACSTAIDGRARVRMKRLDDWTEPPALWVALIGGSGAKKSPIIRDSWRVLEEAQGRALAQHKADMARWEALLKAEQARASKPTPGIRLVSHQPTMEAIQEILKTQDRGIGVLCDELAGFIGGLEKYSGRGGAASDRAFWLRAFHGGPFVVDRVGRGTVTINNLVVTVCGGIQPDRLKAFRDLTDDGLFQRFIPILVAQGSLGTDEAATETDFPLRLEALLDASRGAPQVQFSAPALAIQRAFEAWLWDFERAEPLGPKFSTFISKLPGVFGRLCLTLQFLEPAGLGYVISEKTALAARRLIVDTVIPHAGLVYMMIGEGTAQPEHTQAVAAYLLARQPPRIVVSDLTTSVRCCRGLTVADVGQLVSPLVAGGWLEPENDHPTNRAWKVNPEIFRKFARQARTEIDRRALARAAILNQVENEDSQK
jgi:hypothetical protein